MSVSNNDIRKIAHLAHLRVSDDEVNQYASQLTATFDLIGQIAEIDTSDITPMAHPLHCSQRLRADDVSEHDQHEKFQAIAPATEAGLYLVPKVIE